MSEHGCFETSPIVPVLCQAVNDICVIMVVETTEAKEKLLRMTVCGCCFRKRDYPPGEPIMATDSTDKAHQVKDLRRLICVLLFFAVSWMNHEATKGVTVDQSVTELLTIVSPGIPL